MTTTNSRGLFARQIARGCAQRGRLDPVYQVLSDHYTRMLQRLYPVWALVGPGLSDPAHIEIHSRTVMLDSDELLGTREEIAAGRLEGQRVLVSLGAGIHEVFHAVHTKPWALERTVVLESSQDPAETALGADRRLLEEARMEAHGCRDYPPATRRATFITNALRAAVAHVILPRFCAQIALAMATGRPVTRDLCGYTMGYLQARTHYGAVDPQTLAGLRVIWQRVLGAGDMQALDDLFARLIWVPDGDNDALDAIARDYRTIIGPPDPPTSPSGRQTATDGSESAGPGQPSQTGGQPQAGDTGSQDAGAGEGTQPAPGSLNEALEQTARKIAEGVLEQFNEDLELQEIVAQATGGQQPVVTSGRGTGMPTGRMPDRGVNRPPAPDEVAQAAQYANRLAQARTVGQVRVDKRTPGGRFNARGYVRARAQRQHRQPITSRSWEIRKQVRSPLQEPHVGLVIDTSGSMGAYEYALGPIAWILTSGLHRFGGKVAIALFGGGCQLLSDGAKPLTQVPGIRTGGGTAFGADAIDLVCGELEMDNPRRPRLVYVISDGGWADCENGVRRIRALREHGVPTIHLSIGALPPLGVECYRICQLDDPASALDVIATDTVEALRAPNAGHQRPS